MTFIKKTKSERLSEVIKVLKQLINFGFPSQNEGILKLKEVLKQWVKDGEYKKGKIKLIGYERVILYELYIRKGTEIAVNLKFVKGL